VEITGVQLQITTNFVEDLVNDTQFLLETKRFSVVVKEHFWNVAKFNNVDILICTLDQDFFEEKLEEPNVFAQI
jgi:hypothetical protein